MTSGRRRDNDTPLRVVLDARKLGDGGIGVYIENVIRGLDSAAGGAAQVTAIVSPDRRACLPEIQHGARLQVVEDAASKYSLDELTKMPRRINNELRQADVFHAPHYTLPYSLGIPSVVTIHDIIHVTKPDSLLHRLLGSFLIRSALKRATAAITVSEASAQEIKRHFGKSDIGVVYNALRDEFFATHQNGNSSNEICFVHPALEAGEQTSNTSAFLLFVADNRPHKGFDVLYRAWLKLRVQYPDLRLVVVGRGFENIVATHHAAAETGAIIQLPSLHARELRGLYAKARAVVVPSYEEGFGFIPLEALASSATVVSRDLPCIREVCGGAPVYFADDLELFDVLATVLAAGPELMLESRRELGRERSQDFRLHTFGEQILAVYEKVSGLSVARRPHSRELFRPREVMAQ